MGKVSAEKGLSSQRSSTIKRGLLIAACIAALLLVWSFLNAKQVGYSLNPTLLASPSSAATAAASTSALCDISFDKYVSSPLEQRWLDNVEKWQDDYCSAWEREREELVQLLKAIETAQQDPTSKNAFLSKYLSRFEQTVTCQDGAKKKRVVWIEPLAGPLRHPLALCGLNNQTDQYYLLRTYIVLNSARDLPDGAYGPSWFFDLGASMYDSGPGGASQRYFVEEFDNRGLNFSGMWLWEPSPWGNVFKEQAYNDKIAYKYHYFTTFADTNLESGFSPYYIMRKVAKPRDYVVYKLDIDTVDVENTLVQQLMDNPDLVSLVDEFFFEHHVNFKEMVVWWAGVYDRNVTLAGSYQLFLKLRKMGIRAHSWP